jgi:EpsI family protein
MSVSPSTSTSPSDAETRRSPIWGIEANRLARGMPWVRLAVVAAVLAASGGIRLWQEHRLGQTLRQGRISPFPLVELPMNLGYWKGQDITMDPRLVRRTGSSDVITRRYINQRTGVTIDAVILYGPTSDMFIHTPELCYPAAGFEPLSDTSERPIVVEGVGTVPFRSLAFTKGEGGLTDMQEVYYSLWYDGHWTTQSTTPKASQRIPGMYKIQISRRISTRERRDLDNPCEPLLVSLISEIESRMVKGRSLSTSPTASH